ncbi:hypothetical protein MXM82_01630 [Pseudomonas asiatica]|uniref:DUF7716 domain-containing protein n=1 Tax=Pseudomonas asiatica TaxID=2219225 RepID=UPI002DB69F98|nr:hypothetical protein [Pseudomonas asiatica]MEB6587840.1 hypothetical protein [Pseudomonas asiatica]
MNEANGQLRSLNKSSLKIKRVDSRNYKTRRVEGSMKTYSIREVLESLDKMPDSWFYLPNASWTLSTRGVFSLDSRDFAPDSTDYLPPQVASEGWVETLDTPMIKDVIDYTDQQLPAATVEDYFEAFKYYFENDAFLEF